MAQTAAHLVDHVIPHVPVRQWVLSLPIPLEFMQRLAALVLCPRRTALECSREVRASDCFAATNSWS